MSRLRDWARALKHDAYALYYAVRDPRTPWYVKLLAGAIVAYALSPIDLIPDFIPIIGYLDELILLPIALWFALRLVPRQALADARARAAQAADRPVSRAAAAVIVALWVAGAALCAAWLWRALG
ncbi:MAG: YkvA family protein [Betaproteobacteria bacterium]|nr:YkvA family protein [Betaproteobacteria bacterium]